MKIIVLNALFMFLTITNNVNQYHHTEKFILLLRLFHFSSKITII